MYTDFELLEKLRLRDPAALETAIHKYAPYVAAVAKKSLGPAGAQEDVEELCADTFAALWENAKKLRDDSSLKYWLAVVVRNASRKRLGQIRLEEPLEENMLEIPSQPVFGEAERKEEIRQVREAVNSLSPEDRDIFLRHYFWKQGVAQIARETGINENTVKTRLKRGREKLRQKLIKEGCSL